MAKVTFRHILLRKSLYVIYYIFLSTQHLFPAGGICCLGRHVSAMYEYAISGPRSLKLKTKLLGLSPRANYTD
jgi:hypothetical protein